jgi:hypothetical protein
MREASIQTRGRLLALREAVVPVKVGYDGWPDHLMLLGNGLHFWVEWKAPGGRLRPNQVVRIEGLRQAGDTVHVLDDADALPAHIREFRRANSR